MTLPVDETEKPANVLYAEIALWLWTFGTCLYGMYATWKSIPELEQTMQDQLQGALQIDPKTILYAVVAGYTLLGLTSAWIVLKIGQGKNWARSSLLWGLIFQAGSEVFSSSRDVATFVADIPDYGLQLAALYLLYSQPGRLWFKERPLGRAAPQR